MILPFTSLLPFPSTSVLASSFLKAAADLRGVLVARSARGRVSSGGSSLVGVEGSTMRGSGVTIRVWEGSEDGRFDVVDPLVLGADIVSFRELRFDCCSTAILPKSGS
jgi:hypothetical protein